MAKNNEPAFPEPKGVYVQSDSGMTKREYAAIAIMAGYASDPECKYDSTTKAQWAVEEADALLRELAK